MFVYMSACIYVYWHWVIGKCSYAVASIASYPIQVALIYDGAYVSPPHYPNVGAVCDNGPCLHLKKFWSAIGQSAMLGC